MFADMLAMLAGSFRLLMVLFFGSAPVFVMLTKDLRTKLQAEIGYRPRLNSTVLWEAVKQERKDAIKIKCAFYLGWWMRTVFMLMWLSVFAQIVLKDAS